MGRDEKQAPLKTPAWEASSPFEKVARSHARAAHEKRRECEGVEKDRKESSPFPAPLSLAPFLTARFARHSK